MKVFCSFVNINILLVIAIVKGGNGDNDGNSGDNGNYEKEEGIFVLTENNFDKFIDNNPTVLIEFYAPWCGHCKALAPEYEKAAKRLSIPLAKVDATVESELASRFDVQGYPTLKFWHNSKDPTDYDGERDADGIVQWITARTDPNYKPSPEEVVALTKETFDEFIANNPLVLVEFYAPWCGHCKRLAPEYEKAAKKLKDMQKRIILAKVDATVEKILADQYDVSGFPTLKIFRNGKRFDYTGPRDVNGIVNYMIDQEQPAAKKLNTIIEIQRFMPKDDIAILGFFDSESTKLLEALSEAAEMAREEFGKIGYTLDAKVREHFKVRENEIVIFYPEIFWSKFEPKAVEYSKNTASAEDLVAFFRDNCTPLVGQMTRKNIANRYSKLPLVVIYYNVDFSYEYIEGTQYWRNKILDVANNYKDRKYRFAIADEEEFSKELAEVGLGDSGLEHNIIVFGVDGKKYPMNPDEFNNDLEENFVNFMKKISSGKIKAYVKSAPLPQDDKGPVKTVVASNFDKIVLDETKDVLIEFYAPWCGHCKAFEPKYKELAIRLKKEQPNLILAKYDAIANDVLKNYVVEGFPTIYFVPSSKKSTPIKYTGNRDPEDLIKFMKANGVVSFQGKTEL